MDLTKSFSPLVKFGFLYLTAFRMQHAHTHRARVRQQVFTSVRGSLFGHQLRFQNERMKASLSAQKDEDAVNTNVA